MNRVYKKIKYNNSSTTMSKEFMKFCLYLNIREEEFELYLKNIKFYFSNS